MKSFFAAVLYLLFLSATKASAWTLTLDQSSVSPGCELRFTIVGTKSISSPYSPREVAFEFSLSGLEANPAQWDPDKNGNITFTHQRSTLVLIPKTAPIGFVTLDARDSNWVKIATKTFRIQSGIPCSIPSHKSKWIKGKRHINFEAKSGVEYELTCKGDLSLHACSFDIKTASYDNHHGGQPKWTPHECTESGFPNRTLEKYKTMIFDSGDLILNGTGSVPTGHSAQDGAMCVIISNQPFRLRKVPPSEMAELH